MSSDAIRAFLADFVSAWEREDVQALAACYALECTIESPMFHTVRGRAAVERSYAELFRAFTDQTIRVEETVIGGEDPARAVVIWTATATHAGEVYGIPGSGKRIDATIAFVLSFRDGLILHERRIYDFTFMLVQLGVLKTKGA